MTGKSILIIGARIPTPDLDAGSERMICLLSQLRELFPSVTFIPKFPSAWPPYNKQVKEATARLKRNRISVPPQVENRSLAVFLENSGREFDTIILSDVYVAAECLPQVRKINPGAHIIFDTVDLHYLRYFREAKLRRSQVLLKKAMEIKQQEISTVNRADLTIVVTKREKEILEKECPSRKIAVLSSVYQEKNRSIPFEARKDLLFIGSFDHRPNLDAVEYFLNDVFPVILKKIESIKLYIIGANPPKWVREFNTGNTVVTGYIPDLRLYFNKCRLSIAPLRFGAGIKGKILTSMSYGLPIVASSIAAEGLQVQNGEHLFTADESRLFAERLVEVYQDKALWEKFSVAGINMIRRFYSHEAFHSSLIKLLDELEI